MSLSLSRSLAFHSMAYSLSFIYSTFGGLPVRGSYYYLFYLCSRSSIANPLSHHVLCVRPVPFVRKFELSCKPLVALKFLRGFSPRFECFEQPPTTGQHSMVGGYAYFLLFATHQRFNCEPSFASRLTHFPEAFIHTSTRVYELVVAPIFPELQV